MNYLYRFLDKDNNILYIGKTNKSVVERCRNHNHLSEDCYNEIEKVEYVEIENDSDCSVLEIYLINKYLPKYNTSGKGKGLTKISLDTSFLKWSFLDLKACGISFKTKAKQQLTPEEIKKRRQIGIEKAKKEGKYTGRKPIKIDRETFVEACRSWRNGERTARSVYKEFQISPQTFYRRVHQWGL